MIMHYNTTHINVRGTSHMPVNFMWPFQTPDVTAVHVYIAHSRYLICVCQSP